MNSQTEAATSQFVPIVTRGANARNAAGAAGGDAAVVDATVVRAPETGNPV